MIVVDDAFDVIEVTFDVSRAFCDTGRERARNFLHGLLIAQHRPGEGPGNDPIRNLLAGSPVDSSGERVGAQETVDL